MNDFFRRLRYLWNRNRLERELSDEMDFHREMAAREAELRKELRLTATLIERSTAKPPRSRVSKAATAKRSGGAKTRRRP